LPDTKPACHADSSIVSTPCCSMGRFCESRAYRASTPLKHTPPRWCRPQPRGSPRRPRQGMKQAAGNRTRGPAVAAAVRCRSKTATPTTPRGERFASSKELSTSSPLVGASPAGSPARVSRVGTRRLQQRRCGRLD
jgi:hypothetical protein